MNEPELIKLLEEIIESADSYYTESNPDVPRILENIVLNAAGMIKMLSKDADTMDTQITLGKIQNSQHEQRLLEVAYWLDQNKFSCTMAIVDGLVYYDITRYKDQPLSVSLLKINNENFKEYAFKTLIKALSRKLSEV